MNSKLLSLLTNCVGYELYGGDGREVTFSNGVPTIVCNTNEVATCEAIARKVYSDLDDIGLLPHPTDIENKINALTAYKEF